MQTAASAVRVRIQNLLTRVGERLSVQNIHRLNAVVNYLEAGRWLKANGFANSPRFQTRSELHRAAGAPIAEERVLYLEFGVYYGESLRYWCNILRHPESSLHGFDSFEGLPEDWDALRGKGTFDVGGRLPTFDDPRVTLHRGWFNETLPSFAPPPHDRMVVHLDADLYSSTAFVLQTLNPFLKPGSILIFDEFCDRVHEMRAFDEHLRSTRSTFRFLGGTSNLEQVAFEMIA